MTAVDLLQRIGLNKYEAEAYYTLLVMGPLTGYELGKRSTVPLSRSYEILERLTQKGLTLVQPGDPPHYAAADPGQFLGHVRTTVATTLDALADILASLPRSDTAGEFWVLRGRPAILGRAEAMIDAARYTVGLHWPDAEQDALGTAIARAQARGCLLVPPPASAAVHGAVLLLVDSREGLIGTLSPSERCQAVVAANAGVIAALGSYFARPKPLERPAAATQGADVEPRDRLSWVAWEEHKQRRLHRIGGDDQVA
jgi:hypothetical protein